MPPGEPSDLNSLVTEIQKVCSTKVRSNFPTTHGRIPWHYWDGKCMHIVYQFLLYIRCRSNQKKHKKQKTSNRFIGPTHKVTSASLTYCATYKSESESHSVLSDSLRPHELYSPWNSPGQKTGVGSLSLLQGIFPTQGHNSGLLHCRWILYHLSPGKPWPLWTLSKPC